MQFTTTSNTRFPGLFKPGYIGQLWIKNRLIKAPTCTRFADTQGYVTKRLIEHYRKLARGGVGMIIVEFAHVDDIASQTIGNQLSATSDDMLPGLDWLATMIKDNGAAACLQIAHAGIARIQCKSPVKAPSAVKWAKYLPIPDPEELTVSEIKTIIAAFGDAALRAKTAGFDMLEIHGAHSYLISNFLSPRYNQRTDEYGSELTGRVRFLQDVVADVRRKVGTEYPLSVRLSGTDFDAEQPITIEETVEVAKALEKAGVDMIHVSYGGHASMGREGSSMYAPPASNVWLAAEVRKAIGIPVAAVGSINRPELAENILKSGNADFISVARPLLADPEYPRKALEGREDDIRPCIRCSDGCYDRGIYVGSIKCTVNPTLGFEGSLHTQSGSAPKKVLVIGGGPAGIEAARLAAFRGHDVILYEKKNLGGMLIPASVPDFKADIGLFLEYLLAQLNKTGVRVVMAEANAATVREIKPDAVIVASGATSLTPDVMGISRASVVDPIDVFRGAQTGKSVVIIGGGMIGSDAALFLAEQGKKVTITTRGSAIGRGLSNRARGDFFTRMSRQDIDVRTGVYLEEITDHGVITSAEDGAKYEIECDSVIPASGLVPNRQLFNELVDTGGVSQLFAVGDCVVPRTILEAVHEGYVVANNI